MKRRMFPLPAVLALVLAGAHAAAVAAPVSCGPSLESDAGAVARAGAALAEAQARPGAHKLALADAYAALAGASARELGSMTRPSASGATPAHLLAHAQLIWSAAPRDAALAERLWHQARADLADGQCALALGMLDSAFDTSGGSASHTAALTVSIVHDLARVAGALREHSVLRSLAWNIEEALKSDPAPHTGDGLEAYLALSRHYYDEGHGGRAEAMLRRLLERARTARPRDEALVDRLGFELASALYAQSRYREAEALIARLPRRAFALAPEDEAHKRAESDMGERVRRGDLAGALALGREMLARYLAEGEGSAADAASPGRQAALRDVHASRIADIRGDIGEILHARGELAPALASYELALRGYGQAGKGASYRARRIQADMALLYHARGELSRALALHREVLDALLPIVGEDHPDVRDAEDEIGALHLALKDYAAAAPFFARKLERLEQDDRAGAIRTLERAEKLWAEAGERGTAGLRKTRALLAAQRAGGAGKRPGAR